MANLIDMWFQYDTSGTTWMKQSCLFWLIIFIFGYEIRQITILKLLSFFYVLWTACIIPFYLSNYSGCIPWLVYLYLVDSSDQDLMLWNLKYSNHRAINTWPRWTVKNLYIFCFFLYIWWRSYKGLLFARKLFSLHFLSKSECILEGWSVFV